jgi:hypothetical protein
MYANAAAKFKRRDAQPAAWAVTGQMWKAVIVPTCAYCLILKSEVGSVTRCTVLSFDRFSRQSGRTFSMITSFVSLSSDSYRLPRRSPPLRFVVRVPHLLSDVLLVFFVPGRIDTPAAS